MTSTTMDQTMNTTFRKWLIGAILLLASSTTYQVWAILTPAIAEVKGTYQLLLENTQYLRQKVDEIHHDLQELKHGH